MSEITRRDFLKLVTGTASALGLGALLIPLVTYFFPSKLEEVPSDPVLVCAENELPVGDSRLVKFGRYPALVINTEQGLRVYSAVCTHFACLVKWEPESGRIMCPCHEGYFDPLDGHVISGPPPEPLMPFEVEVVDGQIYIKAGEAV